MMRTSDPLALRAGPYAASVLPHAGARLASLTWNDGMRDFDLIVPLPAGIAFDPHHWPAGGAFAMAPYSNRLGGAGFTWGGRRIELTAPPGENYALLGFAHRSSWELLSHAPAATVLRYTHRADHEGWPWPFELTMQVELDARGAMLRLSITNQAEEPMPAGLGWHPYHPARGLTTRPQAEVLLAAHARRDVGLDGLARLPPHTGPGEATPFALTSADLHHQTCVFEDWTGDASLPLAPGLRIAVQTTGARHLVLHAAKGLAHVCLEPVTLLPGALQVYAAQQSAALIALAPQCTREITWRCAVVAGP